MNKPAPDIFQYMGITGIDFELPWADLKPPKRKSPLFSQAVQTLADYGAEKAAEAATLNPNSDVSPRITLDDMRSLVAVLEAGGVEGKHAIIIDHDTAKYFAVLRHDMENVEL